MKRYVALLVLRVRWNGFSFLSHGLSSVLALCLFFAAHSAWAEGAVVLATYEGVINPVAAEYFHDALVFAEVGGFVVRTEEARAALQHDEHVVFIRMRMQAVFAA